MSPAGAPDALNREATLAVPKLPMVLTLVVNAIKSR
jgi:hypothetical protein